MDNSITGRAAIESKRVFVEVIAKMFMTYRALVRTGQPSLDQASFPMAQGQQILAHIRRFADPLVFVSQRAQAVVAAPTIRLGLRPCLNLDLVG